MIFQFHWDEEAGIHSALQTPLVEYCFLLIVPGYITLRAQDNGEVAARCKPETGDHPDLINFLRGVCDVINGFTITPPQTGFTLDNLKKIAAMMVRRPNRGDFGWKARYGRGYPWMDLDGSAEYTDWWSTG